MTDNDPKILSGFCRNAAHEWCANRDWAESNCQCLCHKPRPAPRCDEIIEKLKAERDALKHDIERHVAIATEYANEADALKAENESHKETIRRAVASSEALAKSNADLRALVAEMRSTLRDIQERAVEQGWKITASQCAAVLAKGEKK